MPEKVMKKGATRGLAFITSCGIICYNEQIEILAHNQTGEK